ncbi:MAG: hypothetical protein JSU77_02385 [Fidelibacterota bacterium]|nr:MAG: hypothetical protein JSU77_02385 [Candidatus Neomarinimicrobiota bacterium]
MASINDLFDTVVGWLKALVELGFALALVFLVVDVLFGPLTGIVDNVAALINTFVDNGVVGLIALLFFLAIYKS